MPANQSEAVIFAGNSEYPPSFQKEKRGLCGLKVNGINSYLNSVIHLLSYVPALMEIFRSVNFDKIDSNIVRAIGETINTIWSGQYRIYTIDGIEKMLLSSDKNFMSYSNKTPQHVLYFILRALLDEFYFDELPCTPPSIVSDPYFEWTGVGGRYYNMVKEVFGG
jgi:membrane-anchored glycerophosphoryl diester phosphodiesterase (GDPDase)